MDGGTHPTINGRTKDGRFAPGNDGGPGNPHLPKVQELRKAAFEAVGPAEMKAVFLRAYQIVMADDDKGQPCSQAIAAARFIADYTLGKPAQSAEVSVDASTGSLRIVLERESE